MNFYKLLYLYLLIGIISVYVLQLDLLHFHSNLRVRHFISDPYQSYNTLLTV